MNIDIDLILEGLNGKGAIYLSNQEAAKSLDVLKNHNIGAIISLTKKPKLTHSKGDIAYYLHISLQDKESANISQYFQTTYRFIEDSRKLTNVLIHCIAGISRSATILIAYIIKKYEYSLSTAFNIVKRKRDKIDPNEGFIKQLKKYYLNTKRQKTEKSQPEQIFQKNTQLQITTINHKQTLANSQDKSHLSKTLHKNPRNYSQFIKSKLKDDCSLNPKISKKIERLKTSIITNSNVFDKIYLTQQQKFSQLLKSKIYKNKEKVK